MDYNCDPNDKKKKMLEWWAILDQHIFDAKITRTSLRNSVIASDIELRVRLDEFMHILNNYKIPLLVLSAGFGSVVIELLKNNKVFELENLRVISNIIKFDEHGRGLKEFNFKTIHMYNKNEAVLFDEEYCDLVENKQNVIVIGDAEGKLLNLNSKFYLIKF